MYKKSRKNEKASKRKIKWKFTRNRETNMRTNKANTQTSTEMKN